MANEYFLDTNTAIYFLQDLAPVRLRVQQHPLKFLPFVTAAELLYGAKRSARAKVNLRTYDLFLARFIIVYPDRRTLETYSDLRVQLKEMGRPVPMNDVWQAALAIQHAATLVTNDEHFEGIPGLQTENWTR